MKVFGLLAVVGGLRFGISGFRFVAFDVGVAGLEPLPRVTQHEALC